MVSHRLCAKLTELDTDQQYAITVIGQEPEPAYDRVHLGDLFEGKTIQDLQLGSRAWYQERGIELITGQQVVGIDAVKQEVSTQSGEAYPYEKLVLATGSRAFVPPIDGTNLPGVYVYRTAHDVELIRKAAVTARSCAVIGGGLLGLEAARSVNQLGPNVTVIQAANALMPRQLDAAGSSILNRKMTQMGVDIRLSALTQGISQSNGGLTLSFERNHDPLTVDMVVIAAGIRPRDELARKMGLRVGAAPGGVVIDNTLQTSLPGVFAIGECARHQGSIYGLVAPGYEMADTLAKRLTGDTKTSFAKGDESTRLKIAGETVAVLGQFDADDARSVSVHRAGMRRTLLLRNNRLIGATVIGQWDQLADIQNAIDDEKIITSRRLRKFQETGDLFPITAASLPVIQWPEKRTVCNCLKINRGQLSEAVTNGCTTIESISQCTGAGTVCGSCQPLLAELAGADPSTAAKPKAVRTMLVISALALVSAVLIASLKPLPLADSFEDAWYQFDRIWRVGWIKQTTGYTLVGLSLLAMVLSLRKRVKFLRKLGDLGYYRALHTTLGLLCLGGLIVHTGMHMGSNLNFWLMLVFLSLNGLGAFAGIVTALEAKGQGPLSLWARRWRPVLTWAHLILFWPLPVLVGFHIAAVYLY